MISIGLRSGKASRDASVLRPEFAVLPEPEAMGVRSSLPGCFTEPGRPREGVPAKSKSDGICTRMPLSASPCEQVGCAIQIRPLQHISIAIAAPNKSPRRTSMLTAFGSARTNGLPLELCGPTSHLSFLLRASVRHTGRCDRPKRHIGFLRRVGSLGRDGIND